MASCGSKQSQIDETFNDDEINQLQRWFGDESISPGGMRSTQMFARNLQLSSDDYVLDIACGVGGYSFYMAEKFDARVLGVDLSSNMIKNARSKLKQKSDIVQQKVEFEIGDFDTMNYKENTFSVIFSKDSIMFCNNIDRLCKNMIKWLRPGGRIFIIDHCKGENADPDQEFFQYGAFRGYHLSTIKEFVNSLKAAGFIDVRGSDHTEDLVKYSVEDLEHFEAGKDTFVEEFGQDAYNSQLHIIRMKLRWHSLRWTNWGFFAAKKPKQIK